MNVIFFFFRWVVALNCMLFITAWVPPVSYNIKLNAQRNNQQRSSSTTCPDSLLFLAASSDENNDVSLNPLVATVKPSKTVEIFSLVKQMQADGIDVTSLCVGEPDFLPSQKILDASIEAIQKGLTKYTAVTGTIELRKAISDDLLRRKNVLYDPLTEIVVGNGAKQSVYQAVLALCGTNDKVIIPAPYWPSYPEMVALAGAESVILETNADNGYLLTPEQLRVSLEGNPEAKLIILCNPSNPTGGVFNKEQLEELGKVLLEYPHVSILADEIYERLVYNEEDINNLGSTSFASILDGKLFHRTLIINGFSKAYAMTGMRLGYVAAPQKIARAITTIQSQLTSCAGSISQHAGVAALTQVSDDELNNNIKIMKEKRDYVLQELSGMKNVEVPIAPNGAFYVMPDISAYCTDAIDDTELCLQLLKSQKLALVPGSSFGAPGTIRISYATSMDELKLAMEKLGQFLKELV